MVSLVVLAVLIVALLNVFVPGEEGEKVRGVKRPVLWAIDEPPILKEAEWEEKDGVEIATLPAEKWKELSLQLKALGYFPVYGNWSGECRWTLWAGKELYYVELSGEKIRVARGEVNYLLDWIGENSGCGKPSAETRIIGPDPGKALAYVVTLIGEASQKIGILAFPGEWKWGAPNWSLANWTLRAGNVTVIVLIYGTEEQARYASSFMKDCACIHALGYVALLSLRGDPYDVERLYRALESVMKEEEIRECG